jgi:phosphoribosylamine--glycine ligase
MIDKVLSWRRELPWVGKKGLIIFDDTGFGEEQDELRAAGYIVVGGSAFGELLETDRAFGQKTFKEYGMKTAELHDFKRIEDAITFVRKNRGAWVIKQNGPQHEFNYIGEFEDGSPSPARVRR